MAFHALRAGAEISTPIRDAAITRDDRQSINGLGFRRGQWHKFWFEDVELSDRRQQFLPFAAVDFVSEQVAVHCAFLDGVLAFSTDEHPVTRVVLEQTMRV